MVDSKVRKALKSDWPPVSARIPEILRDSLLSKLAPNKRLSDLIYELLDKANNGRFLGIDAFKK